MRMILLGPPGAGKGTQAKCIIEKFCVPHISTGDIFRNNIREKTVLGIKAKEYINKGELVPDDVTIAIVEDRIKADDCKRGFLLDGFPRTVNQAEALNEVLTKMEIKLDWVINISVSNGFLVERITGRRVCTSCGSSYHVKFNPPLREDICNVCGGKLIHRDDDKEDTVLNRLEVYGNQTAPLIEFYSKIGILYTVDGEQDIEKVFIDIYNTLGSEKNDCN